jgi:hypothetical protein
MECGQDGVGIRLARECDSETTVCEYVVSVIDRR